MTAAWTASRWYPRLSAQGTTTPPAARRSAAPARRAQDIGFCGGISPVFLLGAKRGRMYFRYAA